MTNRLTFDAHPKLLAHRGAGTTEVGLFWSKRTDRAAIAVEDEGTGDRFELPVGADDDPLDLFNHPYACAAARRPPAAATDPAGAAPDRERTAVGEGGARGKPAVSPVRTNPRRQPG